MRPVGRKDIKLDCVYTQKPILYTPTCIGSFFTIGFSRRELIDKLDQNNAEESTLRSNQ